MSLLWQQLDAAKTDRQGWPGNRGSGQNIDSASDDSSLVDMQKSDDADIKNGIGDKTSTASADSVNGTGAAVKDFIFVRLHR